MFLNVSRLKAFSQLSKTVDIHRFHAGFEWPNNLPEVHMYSTSYRTTGPFAQPSICLWGKFCHYPSLTRWLVAQEKVHLPSQNSATKEIQGSAKPAIISVVKKGSPEEMTFQSGLWSWLGEWGDCWVMGEATASKTGQQENNRSEDLLWEDPWWGEWRLEK